MTELPRIYRHPRIYRPEEHQDVEPVPKVEAFMTEMGSIYAYDNFGRTTRYKGRKEELHEPQDLTVFVDMDPSDKDDFIRSLHHSTDPNERLYVVEKQPNGGAKKIHRPEDIQNPDELYLVACVVDKTLQPDRNIVHILKNKKASLQPQIGRYVYDTRRYVGEDGESKAERHLGHRVTEIKYADS